MPSEPIGGLYRKVVIGTTLRLFEGAIPEKVCRARNRQGKEQSHRTSFMTGHLLWQARHGWGVWGANFNLAHGHDMTRYSAILLALVGAG